MLTDAMREFLNWSADMDLRYDKVFSIVDIQEEKLRLWGDVLPFYRNVQQEGGCFVEGSLRELAEYRIQRAEEMQVEDAKKFMQAVRKYLEKEKNEG